MISKNDLKQYRAMKKSIIDIEKRLKILDDKPIEVVKDSVKASSSHWPFIEYTYTAEGFESSRNKKKYENMLKRKKEEYEKRTLNIEYELNKLEDKEMILLLKFKYYDGLNYVQIAFKMNELERELAKKESRRANEEYNDDNVRKKIERFLKKL